MARPEEGRRFLRFFAGATSSGPASAASATAAADGAACDPGHESSSTPCTSPQARCGAFLGGQNARPRSEQQHNIGRSEMVSARKAVVMATGAATEVQSGGAGLAHRCLPLAWGL